MSEEELRPALHGEMVEDLPEAKVETERLRFSENITEKEKARAANLMGCLIVGGFVLCTVSTVLTGLWGGSHYGRDR